MFKDFLPALDRFLKIKERQMDINEADLVMRQKAFDINTAHVAESKAKAEAAQRNAATPLLQRMMEGGPLGEAPAATGNALKPSDKDETVPPPEELSELDELKLEADNIGVEYDETTTVKGLKRKLTNFKKRNPVEAGDAPPLALAPDPLASTGGGEKEYTEEDARFMLQSFRQQANDDDLIADGLKATSDFIMKCVKLPTFTAVMAAENAVGLFGKIVKAGLSLGFNLPEGGE